MTESLYIISEEALTDITDTALWYEAQQIFLGDQFLREFYIVALEKIRLNPKAFKKVIKSGSVRCYKMSRFRIKFFMTTE